MAAVIFFKLCYYSTIFYCLFLTCSVSPISSSTEILRNIAILAIISTAGILFLLRLSIRLLWILQQRQNSFIDIFLSLQAAFILLIRFAIISSRLILIISLDFRNSTEYNYFTELRQISIYLPTEKHSQIRPLAQYIVCPVI